MDFTGIFGAIGMLLQLVIMILKEIFDAQARSRAAQEKFEMDQAKLAEIVQAALARMKKETVDDNQNVPDLQDKVDQALKRKDP